DDRIDGARARSDLRAGSTVACLCPKSMRSRCCHPILRRCPVKPALRCLSLGVAASLFVCAAASADSLIIVGTGRSGSWDTVLEIANGGIAPVTIQLGPVAGYQALCPNPCPLPTLTINPGQTRRLTPDDLAGYHPSGASVSYVNASIPSFTGDISVRARTV